MPDYYYKHGDDVGGPIGARELRALAAEGHIGGTTFVRKGKSGRWVAATSVKGLLTSEAAVAACRTTPDSPTPKPANLKPSATFRYHSTAYGLKWTLFCIGAAVSLALVVNMFSSNGFLLFLLTFAFSAVLWMLTGCTTWMHSVAMTTPRDPDSKITVTWRFLGCKTSTKVVELSEESVVGVNTVVLDDGEKTPVHSLVLDKLPSRPMFKISRFQTLERFREMRGQVSQALGIPCDATDAVARMESAATAPSVAEIQEGDLHMALKLIDGTTVLMVTDIEGSQKSFPLEDYLCVMGKRSTSRTTGHTIRSIWIMPTDEQSQDTNIERDTVYCGTDEEINAGMRFLLSQTHLVDWESIDWGDSPPA